MNAPDNAETRAVRVAQWVKDAGPQMCSHCGIEMPWTGQTWTCPRCGRYASTPALKPADLAVRLRNVDTWIADVEKFSALAAAAATADDLDLYRSHLESAVAAAGTLERTFRNAQGR